MEDKGALSVGVEDLGSGRCLVTVTVGDSSWSRGFDMVTADFGGLCRWFEDVMNTEPGGSSDLESLIMGGVLEMAIRREVGRTVARLAAEQSLVDNPRK